MEDQDPTRIELQTNVKKDLDPTIQRMSGYARHGNTPFDVPFISQIKGNLWQGGCTSRLLLPHFFKHLVSLYPWEAYTVKHTLDSRLEFRMYDSEDQAFTQVDQLARWVNSCVADGPTLVHCQAGLNRSSLIAARSLILNGMEPEKAVELLRERRSPAVLCNPSFERWLKDPDKVSA